jgi:hypothetical protein
MALIIDEEFARLIPPLTKEEFALLEEKCVSEGIRDALITWNGTLIDGHNRLKIATEHDLPFEEKEMDFKDKDEAKLWIIDNQLGKRNLIPYDKVLLQDRKKDILAAQAEKRKIEGNAKGGKSDKKSCPTSQSREEKRQNSTDYKIAKAAGTSEDTVRKVRAIDKSGDKELIRQVRDGETTINRAYMTVKGIEPPKPKTPAQVKQERVESAKQEHEQFQEKKVVSIQEATKDKQNHRTIAVELYKDLSTMGKRIEEIVTKESAGDIDIKALSKDLTYEERNIILNMIGSWRQMLSQIAQEVTSYQQ